MLITGSGNFLQKKLPCPFLRQKEYLSKLMDSSFNPHSDHHNTMNLRNSKQMYNLWLDDLLLPPTDLMLLHCGKVKTSASVRGVPVMYFENLSEIDLQLNWNSTKFDREANLPCKVFKVSVPNQYFLYL